MPRWHQIGPRITFFMLFMDLGAPGFTKEQFLTFSAMLGLRGHLFHVLFLFLLIRGCFHQKLKKNERPQSVFVVFRFSVFLDFKAQGGPYFTDFQIFATCRCIWKPFPPFSTTFEYLDPNQPASQHTTNRCLAKATPLQQA